MKDQKTFLALSEKLPKNVLIWMWVQNNLKFTGREKGKIVQKCKRESLMSMTYPVTIFYILIGSTLCRNPDEHEILKI